MISCFKGKFKVTSPRGYRVLNGKREYHGGLDLVALGDKTVYAIADGKVDGVPWEPNGFGRYVRQLLPDGRRIYYGHMVDGSQKVKAGQTIKKGDALGVMGSSGNSTGAHTHLELRGPGTGKDSLDISALTGIPNAVGTFEADEQAPSKQIVSSNDIVWELDHTYFPITEKANFIAALDEAKKVESPLWWGYYKLVNGIKK